MRAILVLSICAAIIMEFVMDGFSGGILMIGVVICTAVVNSEKPRPHDDRP